MSNYSVALFGPEAQALQEVFISRYISLAGYSVLLFDLVLTLPHEISVIWPANWSIVKILFLLIRYTVPPVVTADIVGMLGLTPSLNTTYCQGMARLITYYQLAALAVFNVIISLRAHALYGRRWAIFLVLAGLLVLAYSAAIALTSHYFGQVIYPTVDYTPIPQFRLCFATQWQGVWLVWLPSTLFEAVLFCLTAYKSWEHWRIFGVSFQTALAGDGFLYHTCTLAARLTVLLVMRFSPSVEIMLFGVNFGFSVVTVASSRMLLYLPSVRKVQQWEQDADVFRDSVDYSNGGWEVAPDVSLRRRRTDLWLANQGGQSFLEQIYQSTRESDSQVRPTMLFMEKLTPTR